MSPLKKKAEKSKEMYEGFLWESIKGQKLLVFCSIDNLPLSDMIFLFTKGKE